MPIGGSILTAVLMIIHAIRAVVPLYVDTVEVCDASELYTGSTLHITMKTLAYTHPWAWAPTFEREVLDAL